MNRRIGLQRQDERVRRRATNVVHRGRILDLLLCELFVRFVHRDGNVCISHVAGASFPVLALHSRMRLVRVGNRLNDVARVERRAATLH